MRFDGKFIKDQTIKPEKFDTDGYVPSAAGDLITLGYFQANGSYVQVENDGIPTTLRNTINLYSGISAADDVANSRTNLSLGGALAKNTVIDSGAHDFDIEKNIASMRLRTVTAFAINGVGADGSGAYGARMLSGGDVIIGGDFSLWNNISVGYIARLAKTGAFNTTFNTNIGTGFDSDVICLDITPADKIIIGGYFSDFNGTSCNGLFALNDDGTPDTTFNTNIGTSLGPGNYASAIAVDTVNSRIYVAGWFPAGFNGNANYANFVCLNYDGTVDTAFMANLGTGLQNEATFVFVQADQKVIVGGYFNSINGVTVGAFARINTNGTLDTAFNTNVGTGTGGSNTNAVAQQSDGKLIVATNGSNIWNGTPLSAGNLIRLNTDGTFDATFYANLGTGFLRFGSPSNDIYALAVDTDNDAIIASGSFDEFNGNPGYVVRLDADGLYEQSYGAGILFDGAYSNYGNPIIIDYNDSKKIYIGGYLNADEVNFYPGIVRFTYGGAINTIQAASGIVNSATLSGMPWTYETDVSTSYTARSLVDKAWVESQATLAANGLNKQGLTIRLGGDLSDYTQVDSRGFWMGLKGEVPGIFIRPKDSGLILDGPTEPSYTINRAYRLNDGNLILGGSWTGWKGSIGGAYDNMVKVNANGLLDESFNSAGINLAGGIINDIAVQSTGKIIIVGSFTSVNGNTVGRIARLNSDGTYDNTFSTGGVGFNKTVYSVIVNGADEIYCVGDFETFNGTAGAGLRKLDPDGTDNAAFTAGLGLGLRFGGGGNGWVSGLRFVSGNRIMVSGAFNIYNLTAQAGITRINEADGTIDGTFSSPLGDGERVYSFDVNSDETKIIVGRNNSGKLILLNFDGSVDSSFVVGTGLEWSLIPSATEPRKIIFSPDDQSFFVGGQFDTYKGVNYSVGGAGGRLLKININGDINPDWVAGVGAGWNQGANERRGPAFEFLPDGKLLYVVGFDTFFKHRQYTTPSSYQFTTLVRGVARMYPNNGNLDMGTIEIRNTPLFYSDDYVDAFTDYALTHKKYVDDAIADAVSAGGGWSVTGTTTITGDVDISHGAHIVYFSGTAASSFGSQVGADGIAATEINQDSVLVQMSSYITGTSYSQIELAVDGFKLTTQDMASGDLYGITVYNGTDNPLEFSISGPVATFAGAQYAADYSASFTARSLVDKAYVDSVAGGGGAFWPLSGNANLTGDVDIEGNFQLVIGGNTESLSFISLTAGDGTDFSNFASLNMSQNFNRLYYYNGGNFRGGVQINSTGMELKGGFNSGNGDTLIKMGDNTAQSTYFRDARTGINQSGLEYFADYSANYVDRSLVDKQYVDTALSVGTWTLNGTTNLVGAVVIDGSGNNLDFENFYDYEITHSSGRFRLLGDGGYELLGTNYGIDLFARNPVSDTAGRIRLYQDVLFLGSTSAGQNGYSDAEYTTVIKFDATTASFIDNRITPVGLEYAADYSANYTNRSLVDKEYVDSVAGGGGWTLNGTSTFTGSVIIDANSSNLDFANIGAFNIGSGTMSTLLTQSYSLSVDAPATQFSQIDFYSSGDAFPNTLIRSITAANVSGDNFVNQQIDFVAMTKNQSTQSNTAVKILSLMSAYTTANPGLGFGTKLEFGSAATNSGQMSSGAGISYISTNGLSTAFRGEFVFSVNNNDIFNGTNILHIGTTGAYYEADYSANYTARSLVDKAYVDSAVSGGVTANNGLTKTGANIKLGGALIEDTTISGLFNLTLGAQNHTLELNNGVGMIFTLDAGGYGFEFNGNDSTSGFDVNVGSIGVRFFAEDNGVDTNGTLSFTSQKTSTNTIATVANFQRSSSGTPANGIGAQILITTRNASNAQRSLSLQHQLVNAAAGAEDSLFAIRAYRNGTLTDFFKIEGDNGGLLLSTHYGVVNYNADFSANFTARSLVDKAYVDSVVAGGAFWPLAGSATLTNNVNIGGAFDVAFGGITGVEIDTTDGTTDTYAYFNEDGVDFGTANGAFDHYGLGHFEKGYWSIGAAFSGGVITLEAFTNPVKMQIAATGTFAATFAGIQYISDYSTNFVARSLVDKEYVDDTILSIVYPTPVTQNITGAVSIDLSTGTTFYLTLTGNVTSFTFTNEVVGRQYTFYFLQNTSYKTLAFTAGKFRFSLGTTPTLTDPTTNGTAGPARSVDILSAHCQVSGRLDAVLTQDMIEN